MDDDAPDPGILFDIQDDLVPVQRVVGQPVPPPLPDEPADQPLPVPVRDHHIPLPNVQRTIDDEQRAGQNAGPLHPPADVAPEKRRGRPYDEVIMQIERPIRMIVGG